ncbi:hypothetical protein [Nonomuraea jiangxiensis]|uniref:Uncharacterized protein n=1 Tax=Nonomuraea jiangxiensis TaxID=633440 RepID=A0A1G9U0C0_9ACTN|nr:hypothetical protein [Nonomuraea jiangxiensis]SDM53312.1 hypothetical protein SAMN05421869_14662 [Nonomuraea jiangxiensis]
MIPQGRELGQGRRALLALLALGVTALSIHAIFASGFGRLPAAGRGTAAGPAEPVLAVVSGDFWLTYLPAGLERGGGGAIRQEPGVAGEWARFRSAGGFVEARVEHGAVAGGWASYRERVAVPGAREITVRGRPAVAGRHPGGGLMIAWLERAGTGAWIRVSDSLSGDLMAIAASAKSL